MVLVIGAAGGPTIPVQVARSIVGVLDFGMTAEEALAMPLLMAFGSTVITEEGGVVEGMAAELEALGHGSVRALTPRGKANALRDDVGRRTLADDDDVVDALQRTGTRHEKAGLQRLFDLRTRQNAEVDHHTVLPEERAK